MTVRLCWPLLGSLCGCEGPPPPLHHTHHSLPASIHKPEIPLKFQNRRFIYLPYGTVASESGCLCIITITLQILKLRVIVRLGISILTWVCNFELHSRMITGYKSEIWGRRWIIFDEGRWLCEHKAWSSVSEHGSLWGKAWGMTEAPLSSYGNRGWEAVERRKWYKKRGWSMKRKYKW